MSIPWRSLKLEKNARACQCVPKLVSPRFRFCHQTGCPPQIMTFCWRIPSQLWSRLHEISQRQLLCIIRKRLQARMLCDARLTYICDITMNKIGHMLVFSYQTQLAKYATERLTALQRRADTLRSSRCHVCSCVFVQARKSFFHLSVPRFLLSLWNRICLGPDHPRTKTAAMDLEHARASPF